MKRRDFFRSASLVSAGLLVPDFLRASTPAFLAGGRKLVVVQLTGGNDGLNTVIPFSDDAYRRLRPALAIERGQELRLTDHLGLHPALAGLRAIHDVGELCVVQGVGYPNPDRSHFRSMDIWHTASASDEYLTTGWLGRYLDMRGTASHDVIELADTLSLANKGAERKALAMRDPQRFHAALRERFVAGLAGGGAVPHPQLAYLYGTMNETWRSAEYIQEKLGQGAPREVKKRNALRQQLATVSRLIRAGMDTSVYYTSLGGFDTHANQLGRQSALFAQLNESISAFWANMANAGMQDQVVIMVFSEFGRRAGENAGRGTDHGTAGPMFLIGKGLASPGLFGNTPDITKLDANGDLIADVDFRNVYAAVLEQWLGADAGRVLPGAPKALRLFRV